MKSKIDNGFIRIHVLRLINIKHKTGSNSGRIQHVDVLRSIPGIGPVASTMLVAEMPELGTITAVARKLVNLANALCKKRQKWVLPKV